MSSYPYAGQNPALYAQTWTSGAPWTTSSSTTSNPTPYTDDPQMTQHYLQQAARPPAPASSAALYGAPAAPNAYAPAPPGPNTAQRLYQTPRSVQQTSAPAPAPIPAPAPPPQSQSQAADSLELHQTTMSHPSYAQAHAFYAPQHTHQQRPPPVTHQHSDPLAYQSLSRSVPVPPAHRNTYAGYIPSAPSVSVANGLVSLPADDPLQIFRSPVESPTASSLNGWAGTPSPAAVASPPLMSPPLRNPRTDGPSSSASVSPTVPPPPLRKTTQTRAPASGRVGRKKRKVGTESDEDEGEDGNEKNK